MRLDWKKMCVEEPTFFSSRTNFFSCSLLLMCVCAYAVYLPYTGLILSHNAKGAPICETFLGNTFLDSPRIRRH